MKETVHTVFIDLEHDDSWGYILDCFNYVVDRLLRNVGCGNEIDLQQKLRRDR